jgi:hypothetical protein
MHEDLYILLHIELSAEVLSSDVWIFMEHRDITGSLLHTAESRPCSRPMFWEEVKHTQV